MTGINLARVVIGGLLAGLVIDIGESIFNGVLFAEDMEAAMARLNLPPVGMNAVAIFMVMGFALGIATVWLYAAIRPRFGAGVTTALCAGATVWFFAYFYPTVGFAMMDLFPARLLAMGLLWGIVELCVAAVAGAWVYREPGGTATRRAGV